MPSFIPLPLSGPSHLASPTDQAATLLRDLAVLRDEELLIAGAIGPWERSFGRAQRPARSALLIEREGQLCARRQLLHVNMACIMQWASEM
jgi:hypothetical protein